VFRFMRPAAARVASATEPELVEWARRAALLDRNAAESLLLAVGPAMLRTIRKVLGGGTPDVEDVLQEAAEGLLGALATFKGECTVRHFACRVSVFTALAWRRSVAFRADRNIDIATPEAEGSENGQESPADKVLRARRREALEMLLDELPPSQAEVLVLHCALDFTIDEIAAAVGRSPETIRSRLRLAKHALRGRIGASTELAEILEARL
jgi:RNA polymerase sigma-70 factor (ECF subfamily)